MVSSATLQDRKIEKNPDNVGVAMLGGSIFCGTAPILKVRYGESSKPRKL